MPKPSIVQEGPPARVASHTEQTFTSMGPTPSPVRVTRSEDGQSSFVLTECEVDTANVQPPPEHTEELDVVDAVQASAPAPKPTVPAGPPLAFEVQTNAEAELENGPHHVPQDDAAYLKGYQRALEDLIEMEPKAHSEEGNASYACSDACDDTNTTVSDEVQGGGRGGAAPSPLEMAWMEEWDPLLDELEEMGFEDRASNRTALLRHGGQVKPTIRQLVRAHADLPAPASIL